MKISLDALCLDYNDVKFFLAVIQAKQLFKIAKVSRAEEDPERGFQRALGKPRALNIKKYLDDGNVIPGSIILSAQEKAALKYDVNEKKITFNAEPNSFLVIDGQHRLYGASMVESSVLLPLCIFNNLSTEQEVQYFLDVNGLQKGVPNTLRIELLKFIAEPTSKDAIRRDIFEKLDKQAESPLCGRMSRTKSIPGKISHVAFKNALDPILDSTPLNNMSQENRIKLLLNYLTAVENIILKIFGSSDKLSNAAFFQAVMGVFVDVCNITMTTLKDYKIESFQKVLDPMTDIDYDYHKGTNQQAIKEFSSAIRNAISINNSVPEDIF